MSELKVSRLESRMGSSPIYNPRDVHTVVCEGQTFLIGIAEGYNAFGLIGTEANGIFMVSEDDKRIVFTEYLCKGMGFDYLEAKQAALQAILGMDSADFQNLVKAMPKLRYDPFKVLPHKPEKLTKQLLRRWQELMDNGFDSYNAETKAEFLGIGKLIAAAIAKALKLKKGTYDIRVNPGGPAVSGDVTLHTDVFLARLDEFTTQEQSIYVDLGRSSLGGDRFMARSCAGRKDYGGDGPNQWFSIFELDHMKKFAKSLAQLPRGPKLLLMLDAADRRVAT